MFLYLWGCSCLDRYRPNLVVNERINFLNRRLENVAQRSSKNILVCMFRKPLLWELLSHLRIKLNGIFLVDAQEIDRIGFLGITIEITLDLMLPFTRKSSSGMSRIQCGPSLKAHNSFQVLEEVLVKEGRSTQAT